MAVTLIVLLNMETAAMIDKYMDIVDIIKANKKSVLITIILLAGLVVLLILIKNPQILKSRADEYGAIEIIGADCHGSKCNAESTKVRIKIDRQKLEELAE